LEIIMNNRGSQLTTIIVLALSLVMAILAGPLTMDSAAQTQPGTAAEQTLVSQPADSGVNWSGAGYGAGAVFCSLLYMPFKLTYGILGGLVGGGTYLVTAGNSQAADTVWRSSLGGDWVVTPAMLQGQEPLNFSGLTATPPAAGQPATASSATTMTTASSGTSRASGTPATASTSSAAGGTLYPSGGPETGTVGRSNIE
jgi:hypothetical protein